MLPFSLWRDLADAIGIVHRLLHCASVFLVRGIIRQSAGHFLVDAIVSRRLIPYLLGGLLCDINDAFIQLRSLGRRFGIHSIHSRKPPANPVARR